VLSALMNEEKIMSPVLVTLDCRDGEPATGKRGILLGCLPRAISVFHRDGKSQDVDFCLSNLESLEALGHVDINEHLSEVAREFTSQTGCPTPWPDGLSLERRTELNSIWDDISEGIRQRRGYWFLHTNPCILIGEPLAKDQDIIWGCECYWRELGPDELSEPVNVEAERSAGVAHAQFLGAAINALGTLSDKDSRLEHQQDKHQ